MSSLTAIFGSSEEDTGDSEKLLELYWNRAELKKEFADLREQTFKLKEQIAAKESLVARAEQKLAHVENLLLDPEWVHNVVANYQLRAFYQSCERKLARFAEQLKRQSEQRVHGKVLSAWQEQRDAESASIQTQIGELRMQMQMLEDQLQAERHRFSMMSGFMRFFRKRSIVKSLENISTDIVGAQQRESELLERLEEVRSREAPDTEGLDIAGKRSINFMILSFAQQLYLHFSEDNLAGLAKEAGDKSVGAVRYGSRADCDFILEILDQRADSMGNVTEFADVLQQRAKLIGAKALFRDDDDAVPDPESVAAVYTIGANGRAREKDANLLGENYWNVANVVSR